VEKEKIEEATALLKVVAGLNALVSQVGGSSFYKCLAPDQVL